MNGVDMRQELFDERDLSGPTSRAAVASRTETTASSHLRPVPMRPVPMCPVPTSIVPDGIDLVAAERAAGAFLNALGIETDSESLRETPRRMAHAYAELFAPKPFVMTTFPNDEDYDELVVARSLPMRSVCEHHLLPFTGVAHVGYLPGDRILGLSKLARVVQHFAARPQVQERLTKQVADWLQSQLNPKAVGVVIVAEHTCMSLRGAEARGSTTVTSSLQGLLRTDSRSRQEFMALTGMTG
jgi:GTP cyclohydrolase I